MLAALIIHRLARPPALAAALIVPLLALAAAPLAATEVALQSPLTTTIEAPGPVPPGSRVVVADVVVGADAPADLGVSAWTADTDGRWDQGRGQALARGLNHLALAQTEARRPLAIGHEGAWNAAEAATSARAGLAFWSAAPSRASILVAQLHVEPAADPDPALRLGDLELGPLRADGSLAGRTGERWSLTAIPAPFPENPYDPDQFSLALVLADARGAQTRYEGFYDQPMRDSDRGDREVVVPAGEGRFRVRVRPRQPGRYRARLDATWGARRLSVELPDLVVEGAPWDGYVRIDQADPRFFAIDGRWFFPLGPNLRSVWDGRCQERMGTALTPDRGLFAYDAYLARLGTAAVSAVEVWMSSWNLALEWRASWPGFHGCGRYSEDNAWRLDRLLDDAWAHGIRVNLVIDNHGQASDRTDHEWENNPYNSACGGMLTSPRELFFDPRALALQERLRRYLVARYGDHPALMSWKLWSEINLTAGERDGSLLRDWHEQATARWHALDPYGHPCTTHWAMDYHSALRDLEVAQLPGLDFLCIDAYHAPESAGWGQPLWDTLADSTGSGEARYGLSRLKKPILVTEYGGNWDACPPAQMQAEHASAPFIALAAGHGGAPMLWWFEWIDQGPHLGPYRAISAFIAGEDPRSSEAASLALTATGVDGLWARAWTRPGRMLGYCADTRWIARGEARPIAGATISSGAAIASGRLALEWWDADRGCRLSASVFDHPGGAVALTPPPFSRHIAFKLARVPDTR